RNASRGLKRETSSPPNPLLPHLARGRLADRMPTRHLGSPDGYGVSEAHLVQIIAKIESNAN
ncbi:MAG: hypothetical protein ABSC21_10245, partial [Terriglobia bacterium]